MVGAFPYPKVRFAHPRLSVVGRLRRPFIALFRDFGEMGKRTVYNVRAYIFLIGGKKRLFSRLKTRS